VASDRESARRFRIFPASAKLGDLSKEDVNQWYDTEVHHGRLQEASRRWAAEAVDQLGEAAWQRYEGYPLAHDAVVRLLMSQNEDDPAAALATWPRDVAELMNMLYGRLTDQGPERLRAVLMLQVYGVPTPREPWAEAAELQPEQLGIALSDPRFACLLQERDSGCYTPFHALFAERLEQELGKEPAATQRRVQRAWDVLQPLLAPKRLANTCPDDFELLAAPQLALRSDGGDLLKCALDLVLGAKVRVGLLASAERDLLLAQERFTGSPEDLAVTHGNLGLIYRKRGELDRAEEMHRKALEIHEQLGRREGMAGNYGNLGLVYRIRGELDRAEEILRKALEINQQLGHRKGLAGAYGNLGLIYQTRGELDRAEEMLRKALEINQQLGHREGMAGAYGNLGLIYQTRGEPDRAEEMLRKALEIDEQLGHREGMASDYGNLGLIYQTRGDLDRAEEMLRNALEIHKQLGHRKGMASNYGNLGLIYRTRGELDRAEEMHRKALEINERLGHREGMANQYGNLGLIYKTRGELDRAEEMHRKALEIHEQLGRREGMASDHGNLGAIYEQRGDLNQARDHWTRARDLFQEIGMPHMIETMKGLLDGLSEKADG
jgi:tetratricopeptide (TPR) repeat protein